jgi:hypothetical protein
MSVPRIGYVVHNKARVALERALSNPRKQAMGVDRESKLTFGFSPQGVGVRTDVFVSEDVLTIRKFANQLDTDAEIASRDLSREDGSAPFVDWFTGLPLHARDKVLVRIERLRELGHELRRPEVVAHGVVKEKQRPGPRYQSGDPP